MERNHIKQPHLAPFFLSALAITRKIGLKGLLPQLLEFFAGSESVMQEPSCRGQQRRVPIDFKLLLDFTHPPVEGGLFEVRQVVRDKLSEDVADG